jgi:sulfoxide reductase heme-binding subunit YedZ
MEQATRSLNRPRGSGDLRRRLLRHHLPIALSSALLLLLFLSLPRFDASKYDQGDIFSGTLPRDFASGETEQHGAGRPQQQQGGGHRPPQQQDRGHQPPQQQSGGHQPPQQGEGQAPTVSPRAEDVEERSVRRRLTTATGYIALVLLAVTLLIGPANVLLRRRNPVSSYLRRDVGAWTAVFSGVHVIVSLTVHGSGQIRHFLDFFVADGSPLRNSFGLGNWTGLAALVIVTGLLALSSDAALRKLKARNWKRLQRLNYALFALVIVHAFFYGALLRETSPYTILLGLTVIAVVVGQTAGVWLFRRRYSRRPAKSS